MKKKHIIIALFTLIVLSLFICGCSQSNKNSNNSSINNDPKMIAVGNKIVTSKTVNLSVEKHVSSMELFNLVNVSEGAIWKIYDANDSFISNKVINLNDGYNTFYIEVSFPDGTYPTTYTLKVFKSYDITVTYVWWEGIMTEHVLKTVTIEQMELFKADYIPEIYGYDFISWHSYSFDEEFTEGRSSQDFKLVAKVTPKPVTIHLIVNGEEWTTIEAEYGERVNLPEPEKEHYTFRPNGVGYWYDKPSYTGSCYSGEYRCYSLGDIYLYGKLFPNTYCIRFEYKEYDLHYVDFKYANYGEHFEIPEPRWQYTYYNGVRHVFVGFLLNGEPFESGIYLYEGDITVTAVYQPVDS